MTNTLDIMQRVKQNDTRIWTPNADADQRTLAAKRAVESYNDNLILGRHLITGDWVIFVKQGPDKPPFPVIGIGPTLPDDPEELTRRLYAADTRIHGDRILTRMMKENEEFTRRERAAAEEATGIAAEAYDWAHRDIKGYAGRVANVKGRKRDQGSRYRPRGERDAD